MTHLVERRADFLLISEMATAANERSLDVLRAIESTVTTLGVLQRLFRNYANEISTQANRVRRGKPSVVIDEDGSIAESLERSEGTAAAVHAELVRQRDVARSNGLLAADDSLEEAFDGAIDAAADLNNAFVNARWTVGEHDADLQQGDGSVVLSKPEDIEAYLKTL